MNKRDWAITMFGLGLREALPAYEQAATAIAGEYYTSTDKKKVEFIRQAKEEVAAALALLQESAGKLDVELAALEESPA
ncbi:hypothetical protein [Aeromonas dhakensis]|uniref:hypothetical protein n=1 Tax=Aeromonas dhakensis TaxID=196024 RepID=UPI0039878086